MVPNLHQLPAVTERLGSIVPNVFSAVFLADMGRLEDTVPGVPMGVFPADMGRLEDKKTCVVTVVLSVATERKPLALGYLCVKYRNGGLIRIIYSVKAIHHTTYKIRIHPPFLYFCTEESLCKV